jgi:hypothetical protein
MNACSVFAGHAHGGGQPQRDLGNVGNGDQRHEQRHQPRQDGHRGALDREVRYAGEHKQHHAERRVQQPDHQV